MILGIYIHIPFCRAKCSYCHFISTPFSVALADRYQNAILREFDYSANSLTDKPDVDSIYLGGGTPSLIPPDYIVELLDACRSHFDVRDNCEISLEANPGTLSAEKIKAFLHSGVNRISLGAQSFTDRELQSIGRLHTARMIIAALTQLREGGLSNISLDLMLGLPGQTRKSWKRNLRIVAGLEIPHLSIYMLDLDDECPMQALVESGSVQLPEEDLTSDLYVETIEFLSEQGYSQYEISNFALPGHACHHNLKYWQRKPVHGLGVGSHSFDGHSRYSNYPQIDDYIEAAGAGKNPVSWREAVSPQQSLSESLFLGLRLRQGVDLDRLQTIYGRNCLAYFEPGMQEFLKRGLIERNGSIVRLTISGMLLSNEVFQLFI